MIYIRAKRRGECKGGMTVCVKCRDCDCTEIKDISLKDVLYEIGATIEDCKRAIESEATNAD